MNRDTALEKLEEALKGHIPAFEERMSEAATFVDHVGACRLHAELLEITSAVEYGIIRNGVVKITEGLSLSFVDGTLVSAFDSGTQTESAFKSFLYSDEPRQEAIELLLKLEGTSPSLFEIYQIDYGQNGESPSVKGMKPLAHDWAIPLFVLEAALAMVEEGLVDQIIHLILEEAAVEILMENLAPECSKWSDRLVDENERWL